MAIALIALSVFPSPAIAQDGPVQFQYGGDMRAKYEEKSFYIYVYCNKYEGDTCTSADGAMRLHIPNPSSWLKALVTL